MKVTIIGAGNMGRGIGTGDAAGGHEVDVGPLVREQQLEHLGLLHISLQQPLELGFSSAIKLHS